jgi:hypothetical protein
VSPYPKSFIDCQELFVMDIIIQFGGSECSGMESNWMNLSIVWRDNGLDRCEGAIRSIGFKEDQSIWNPMSQYWSSGEGFFQGHESHLAVFGEIPFDSFLGESGEQNGDVRVVVNDVSIEVSKPKE